MDRGKVSKSSPVVAGTLKGLIRGVGFLPLPAARAVGRVVGALLWYLPNQFRAASCRNIERCFPELDEKQRQRLVRRSLASTGMTAAEAGAMFHWNRQRLMALEDEFVGEEVMDAALARGQGVLALAPHLGNWEYLSHAVGWRWEMLALYRPPRIAQLDLYLRSSREHLGGTQLAPADARGLRRVARTLEAGRIVGILPDQEPLKKHGVFAPFFGVPALTMTLVGRLVRRFDAAVVYGVAERTVSGGFRVHILEAPQGLGDADPLVAATSLNQGVERCVRAFPDQYTWSYRRFRTRPPEELAARDSAAAMAIAPTASK